LVAGARAGLCPTRANFLLRAPLSNFAVPLRRSLRWLWQVEDLPAKIGIGAAMMLLKRWCQLPAALTIFLQAAPPMDVEE